MNRITTQLSIAVAALGLACTAQAAELTVDFAFTADQVSFLAVDGMQKIGLADGSVPVDEVGAPAIPARFVNILLPSGAENIQITATGDLELLAEGLIPYPAQPRVPKSRVQKPAFVPPNARYASATPWPAAMAALQGVHEMQGYRFISVRVNPLVYVGAEQALYLRPLVSVTATYDLPATTRTIFPKQQAQFEPLVNSLVVNPAASATFAPRVSRVAPRAALDYLIITSPALSNSFQRLADYRASAAGGSYSTRVITTNAVTAFSGTDIQAKIRSCISNNVATLGTTMVVLGGDDTIVPDRNCYVAAGGSTETEMPTDLYYSGLTGSWNSDGDANYGETSDNIDMGWDVIVARIPMRTALQVSNYVSKVIAYDASSGHLVGKIVLGGPNAWDIYTGTDRPSDDVTADGHAGFRSASPAHTSVSDSEAWLRRLYRDGIRPYWTATVGIICDTITSWDGSTCGDYSESSANTLTAFNKNWTHLMFSGHGAPQEWGLESGSFSQSNASSMTGMAAFVYTDACLTGHFDKDSNTIEGSTWTTEPCLGESFLRNTRTAGGAMAYMGCARYGWGEPDAAPASNTSDGGPSTVYAYKFYKRFHEVTNRTVGLAFAMHKADMVSVSGTDDSERWIQFGVNLLGDPALKLPAAAPAVDVPPTLAAIGNKSVIWSNTLQFGVSATITDGDAVTLTVSNKPASASFSPTNNAGTFSWVNAGPVGVYTMTFWAVDNDGADSETITVTVGAGGTSSDLFISEYVEGSSNNKYLEIFNGTGSSVDLANYTLLQFNGGSATPSYALALSGTLANNDVYVIENTSEALGVAADLANGTVMTFNGDDAIALSNTATHAYCDIVGRIGEDPGTAWTDGSFSTVNQTLVRKSSVAGGITSNPGSGFPTLGTEWDTYAVDTVSYLGAHTFDGGGGGGTPTAPTITITDPASASQAVAYATSTYDVAGTCNTAVVGQVKWTNTLTGAAGSTSAFTSWTIGGVALTVGNNLITVRATNSSGTAASDSVTITRGPLVSTNRPAITYSPSGTNQSVIVSNQLTVTVTATDPDGDEVLLVEQSLPSGATFPGALTNSPAASVFTWTPTVVGTYQAVFTAEDNDGAVTSRMQIVVTTPSAGGGQETFANFSAGGSYVSGTFVGQDGSTWAYSLARGDMAINGSAPTLSKAANAYVRSGSIAGGVGSLQLKYRKAFSTALDCNVLVNDTVVGTISGGDGTTQTWSSTTLDISGSVVIMFTNKSSTSGQITLDDITWTGFGGGGGIVDTDGDGMPDEYESANGMDPNSSNTVNGASGDLDGDGFCNLYEYIAGTQPTNLNSVFDARDPLVPDPTANDVEINGVSGRIYTLLYTTNLFAPGWTALRCVTNHSDGPLVLDGDPSLAPGVFYRVKVELEP